MGDLTIKSIGPINDLVKRNILDMIEEDEQSNQKILSYFLKVKETLELIKEY